MLKRILSSKWPTLFLGFVAAVLLHWAATSSEKHLETRLHEGIHSPWFYGPCALFALFTGYVTWWLTERHRVIKDLARYMKANRSAQITAAERKCECLILFLSTQTPVGLNPASAG